MHRYSRARRLCAAAHLSAVAGLCLLAGYRPVPLMAGQPDNPVVATDFNASDSRHYFRRYQATAYINILSINIFSRGGVGFGYAKADERISAKQREVSLQFLSGSIPERAHGLNRFGFIHENIKEHDHVFSEADYFGLITASGEESISQAKAALETKSSTTPFTAARATIDGRSARYSLRHMALSSEYRGADAETLLDRVRASFDHPEAGQTEHVQPLKGDGMGTFLYSVREAMQVTSNKLATRFIYNGKTFSLLAEKREDAKVGQELRAAGLVDSASQVNELTGTIRNEKTREVTNFRLWFDRTSPDLLPLRFEFRPKSFLRLVFQALPAASTPVNRVAAVLKTAGE